jgi:two-component system phosphate regulon sensor histidine kinase PhoR
MAMGQILGAEIASTPPVAGGGRARAGGSSERALESILDGILAVDHEGRITLLNPAAERLLGLRAMTSLDRPLADFAAVDELVDAVLEERERLGQLRVSTRVVEVHRETAELTYVRVASRCLLDHRGEVAGAVFQLQDVTSEHKSDQLKNQYLSIVAHELRTPLTGIKTFSTMMAKGVLGELNERQHGVIETIREQSLRLEHQIDKLVNLGHIDSSEYGQDLERLDLVEVLRQAIAAFEVTAKDREIALEVRLPAGERPVHGDRADLKRALQALVENAIKFTRDGGRVAVGLTDLPADRVRIEVRDDGVGIEPRYHGRIFEKFFQVEDPLTRHHGGSGLGLFFVKNIVEAHGSQVAVDSRLGAGACFSFELSCAAPTTATTDGGRAAETPQSAFPIPGNG